MKVFVDANVLFSAAWSPQGRVGVALASPAALDAEFWTSDYAVAEAQSNLARKRPESLPELRRLLTGFHLVRHAGGDPCPDIGLRDKDRPILAAAIACGADVLVTGDQRDFGPFFKRPELTGGVVIVSVAELFA